MRWMNLLVCGCALVVSSTFAQADDLPGALLEEAATSRKTIAEAIEREVAVQLETASRDTSGDPAATIDRLKQLGDLVKGAPELNAESRAVLNGQIETALRTAAARATERVVAEQTAAANRAAGDDRRRTLDVFARRDQKLAQLMDRFNALLDEKRFELAESVAYEVAEIRPDQPVATGGLGTRTHKAVRQNLQAKTDRQKGVVETLHRAEVAHVPQSDEPPIVYVDAADWQELTLRRKGLRTDMHRERTTEARIREALDEPTKMEFVEIVLADAVAYLRDLHGIEIQLDTRALEEVGLSSDTPVTIDIRGITLRSGLRLLLRQFDLTYAVQDEVLLITTPEAAAMMLESRVHRVADIVLPVENLTGFGQLGGGQNNNMFGVNPGGQNNFGGPNQNQNQNQNQQNPFNNQNNNPFNNQNQNGLPF